MKSEIKCSGPMIMLGEGKVAVGPAIIPVDDKTGLPAMVFNRIEKVPLLMGLDGQPLPRKPGEVLAIIGTPNRHAVQILLKTCMALLDLFDKDEAASKTEAQKISP